jgi:hypothetical protein
MEKKKKKTRLGEIESVDMKGGPTQKKEISSSTLVPDVKKAGYGKVGPYDAFGESKTQSLGRAMQEQKTKEVGQNLAEEMTKAMLERAKKRKAK